MTKQRICSVLALAVLLVAAGCVKPGAVVLKPGEQAILNVNRAVASLAELNKSATQTVIELNKAGLVSRDFTAEMLKYNELVAQSVKVAIAALQSTLPWPEKSSMVMAQLKTMNLPPAALAFIAGPKSIAAVQAYSTVLVSVQAIVAAIQAGVI